MLDINKDLVPELEKSDKKTCTKEEALLVLNCVEHQLENQVRKGRIIKIGNEYDKSDVLFIYWKRKNRGKTFGKIIGITIIIIFILEGKPIRVLMSIISF